MRDQLETDVNLNGGASRMAVPVTEPAFFLGARSPDHSLCTSINPDDLTCHRTCTRNCLLSRPGCKGEPRQSPVRFWPSDACTARVWLAFHRVARVEDHGSDARNMLKQLVGRRLQFA